MFQARGRLDGRKDGVGCCSGGGGLSYHFFSWFDSGFSFVGAWGFRVMALVVLGLAFGVDLNGGPEWWRQGGLLLAIVVVFFFSISLAFRCFPCSILNSFLPPSSCSMLLGLRRRKLTEKKIGL